MSDLGIDHSGLSDLVSSLFQADHHVRFSAPGTSMDPFIRNGDIIEVHPWRDQTPHRMDILLYQRSDGKLVAHRVAHIVQRSSGIKLLMHGDTAPSYKEEISLDQVLGKIVAVEHAGRRIRLDTKLMRVLAWFWALGMPLSAFALRLLRSGLYLIRQVRSQIK